MLSNPTSPYNVQLNERQILNNILNPNAPLVPELVDLGPRVQNLEQAIEQAERVETRRSSRAKPPIDYLFDPIADYLKLHKEGRRN